MEPSGASWLQVLAIGGAIVLIVGGLIWFLLWRNHGQGPAAPLERPPRDDGG
jgi:hypothetical protein